VEAANNHWCNIEEVTEHLPVLTVWKSIDLTEERLLANALKVVRRQRL
jgi:hypothetical protein